MAFVYRNFEKPTDVYILGIGVYGAPALDLTDDYCACGLMLDGKYNRIETSGAVHIFTADELVKHRESLAADYDPEFAPDETVHFLPAYTGPISVEVITEDEKDVSHLYKGDFLYQLEGLEDDEYIEDVNVVLRDGSELRQLTPNEIAALFRG